MPQAKLSEGFGARYRHSLLTHGSRLSDGLGRHQVGLLQASGLRAGLVAPLFDPTMAVYTPGDLRQYHTRTTPAWAFDFDGNLRLYAAGELRIVPSPVGLPSALREPTSANKCTNFNANPVEATGTSMTVGAGAISGFAMAGDTTAQLQVVDDSAALAAAGLARVCTSGKAYRLDNAAGTVQSIVTIVGATGNLNLHTISVYGRAQGGTGSSYIASSTFANGSAVIPVAGTLQRVTAGMTPSAVDRQITIRADAGQVVYFILNQLEELQFVTSPIVVAGGAVTRGFDNIAVPVKVEPGQGFSELIDFVLTAAAPATTRMTNGNDFGTDINTVRSYGVWNGTNYLTTPNVATYGARTRVGLAKDGAGRAVAMNGGAVAADAFPSGLTVPTTTRTPGQQTAGVTTTNDGVVYLHEYRTWRRRLPNDVLRLATQ